MSIHAALRGVGLPSLAPASPIQRRFRSRAVQAKVEPSEKSVEIMRKFSEQYARRSGTYFCVDKSVTSVVIKGLADHKDSVGAPLCPCRHYDDKAAEAGQGYWNCPCVPMRERKECHCMLFLTPDNDFAGKEQTITSEEIKEATGEETKVVLRVSCCLVCTEVQAAKPLDHHRDGDYKFLSSSLSDSHGRKDSLYSMTFRKPFRIDNGVPVMSGFIWAAL